MTETSQRVVAIVDDDDAVRDSLSFLLGVIGQTVETFGTVAEFLTTDLRHFASLILDQHMLSMSGLDLADRLRIGGSTIPILLVTGSLSPSIAARAAKLGVNRGLEKPAREEDVIDFIVAMRGQSS